MPNPKRRHSKTRTSKRRTHDALTARSTGECPQCRERKLPHQVCPHCGFYRGRQVKATSDDV
jgi:large subunit ribosomal protein L32